MSAPKNSTDLATSRVSVGSVPFEVTSLTKATSTVMTLARTQAAQPIRLANAYCVATANSDDTYMEVLANAFNPKTVDELMCKTLVSVGWDGELYDCDFNQMLELPIGGIRRTLWDIKSFEEFNSGEIAIANHCFGCTAGAGSSCSGSLAS